MQDFKTACQTITWGPEQRDHFPAVFDEVAKAGYTGVEIGFRHIQKIKPADLAKMLDQHGLVLAASHVGGNLFDAQQAGRERSMLDEVLDYLQQMGTNLLMYSACDMSPTSSSQPASICSIAGRRTLARAA